MKRMLVYFFWDKDGVVDDYVTYCLNSFKPFCSKILVVVNGHINDAGFSKISSIADELLIRENKELDVGAYKYAFEQIGWENLSLYDEVIVTNFTLFGPVYPLEQMFSKMDSQSCDFWGLVNYPVKKLGITVKNHLQSCFVSYRKKLLSSPDFQGYWESLPEIKTYSDSVEYHEIIQTPYFNDKGYSFDSYIKLDKYPFLSNENPIITRAEALLIGDKCPFIKRRVFYNINGKFQLGITQEKIKYIINYLKYLTSYDIDFISQNICRIIVPIQDKRVLFKWKLLSKFGFTSRRRHHYRKKIAKNKVEKNYIKIFGKNCLYIENLKLAKPAAFYVGKYSYSPADIVIENPFTSIGAFCSIGYRCVLGHGEHPINYLSSSPYFYYNEIGFKSENVKAHGEYWFLKPINIGNDVWIGDGVFVKNGITIGDGAIIGARSVVTKDIPPYAIAVGSPAKVIKYRFDKEIIDKLQKLKWWDLDDEVIKQIPYDNINYAIEFLEKQRLEK